MNSFSHRIRDTTSPPSPHQPTPSPHTPLNGSRLTLLSFHDLDIIQQLQKRAECDPPSFSRPPLPSPLVVQLSTGEDQNRYRGVPSLLPDDNLDPIEDAARLLLIGCDVTGDGGTPLPLPQPVLDPGRDVDDPPGASIVIDPHEQAWERLISRAVPQGELPSLIETLFSDGGATNTVDHLQGGDAQTFIDVIDGALNNLNLTSRIRKECVKSLYKTCARHSLLPGSLQIKLHYNPATVPHSRGGFADVWKSECLGLEVAVKVLRTSSHSDLQKITHRFCKEFITWKTLNHPNVLPLLGVTMTEDRFAMVSEWMTNGNINQFVMVHRDANRFELLCDVARGLIYMHGQGMVHGDLKGLNILVDQAHRARLADFGLLTIISESTTLNSCTQGGTARWMAPELFDPQIQRHCRTVCSDCYALGMVIYEVLSERMPFHRYLDLAISWKVLTGERPERPRGAGFTDDVWEVLKRCWAPQPGDRPSIKDVLQCLEKASESWIPPSPRSPTPTDADDRNTAISEGRMASPEKGKEGPESASPPVLAQRWSRNPPSVPFPLQAILDPRGRAGRRERRGRIGGFLLSGRTLGHNRRPSTDFGAVSLPSSGGPFNETEEVRESAVDDESTECIAVEARNGTVASSLVPHNSTLPLPSASLRSTRIPPTIILRNAFPSIVATTTRSTGPSLAAPLEALPPAKEIPLTFVAGIKSWWGAGTSASVHAEGRLLRKLSYYRSGPPHSLPEVPGRPVIAYSSKIALDDQKRYINTLSITSTSPCNSSPAPAVLLHGYGAGLGCFFKNLSALGEWAASRRSSVYVIDLLGMGRSARVPFIVNAKRDDIPGRVRESEAFFIDSLEEWREKMKLEKVTLVGHDLGAYISVAYVLKYPTRVSRLVLLSPVGVPREPNATAPSREVTDDQTDEADYLSADDAHLATRAEVEEIKSERRNRWWRQILRKVFAYLWEAGWSPLQVVRSAMWYGPVLVGKYVSRRISGLTEEELREIHDYILNITLAKGSGEYCISHILTPGAHARMPLVDRVAGLKIPITFAYGDSDRTGPEGGVKAIENLEAAGNTRSRLYIIQHAGHHLYLDNPTAVNRLLVEELDGGSR